MGPPASRKRSGKKGSCSYCSKLHKKGKKRGDSCKGHAVRTMTAEQLARRNEAK